MIHDYTVDALPICDLYVAVLCLDLCSHVHKPQNNYPLVGRPRLIRVASYVNVLCTGLLLTVSVSIATVSSRRSKRSSLLIDSHDICLSGVSCM